MTDDLKKTGTTILGMVCKDGVVIATERRATMGTLIAHKATKKLYQIDNHLALATAGLVGDLQVLSRYLSAETKLYSLKRDAEMSVHSAATLLSNILNSRKFYPYYVQLILGGWDSTGWRPLRLVEIVKLIHYSLAPSSPVLRRFLLRPAHFLLCRDLPRAKAGCLPQVRNYISRVTPVNTRHHLPTARDLTSFPHAPDCSIDISNHCRHSLLKVPLLACAQCLGKVQRDGEQRTERLRLQPKGVVGKAATGHHRLRERLDSKRYTPQAHIRTKISGPRIPRQPVHRQLWVRAQLIDVLPHAVPCDADNYTSERYGPAITTTSATLAHSQVLADAGASRRLDSSGAWRAARDSADARVVANATNGTGRILDDYDDFPGWPSLSKGSAPEDSDLDGMPDDWEDLQCLDASRPDANLDADGDGYNNLEEYLNGEPAC